MRETASRPQTRAMSVALLDHGLTVPSRGTNDLHSIQQNNIEGENDKTVTFIRVERFPQDIKVSGTGDFLEGKYYSKLLSIAQEATEWALVRDRPGLPGEPARCCTHWRSTAFPS